MVAVIIWAVAETGSATIPVKPKKRGITTAARIVTMSLPCGQVKRVPKVDDAVPVVES